MTWGGVVSDPKLHICKMSCGDAFAALSTCRVFLRLFFHSLSLLPFEAMSSSRSWFSNTKGPSSGWCRLHQQWLLTDPPRSGRARSYRKETYHWFMPPLCMESFCNFSYSKTFLTSGFSKTERRQFKRRLLSPLCRSSNFAPNRILISKSWRVMNTASSSFGVISGFVLLTLPR